MNFNDLIERLSRTPRSQRLLLYVVMYVALIGLFGFLLFMPLNNRLSTLRANETKFNTQLRDIQRQVTSEDKLKEELKRVLEDLKLAIKELPEEREIDDLLKSFSSMGKKAGLDVRQFQPLEEKPREYVAEVPVALQLIGSYHEVAMFFDRLSKMSRIVYFEDMKMTIQEERGGKVYLNVTGNAVTFRFLSDEEIEEQKKKAEASKKGGRRR
ncbi:MAG: type 4a pilus biogenesis protein PilO [Myxococcota bacterium]